MRIAWTNLTGAADGQQAEVAGYPLASAPMGHARTFLLLPEARCCSAHAPADPAGAIEVFATHPIAMRSGPLRLTGRWHVRGDDSYGWRYQLREARTLEAPGWRAVTRRGMLSGGPLMCLSAAACASGTPDPGQTAAARAVIAAGVTADLHSHAGHINSPRRIASGTGFSPVAAPMRQGGMAAICLAMVSDGPTHSLVGGRIRPYRDPAPGELYEFGTLAFRRVHDLIAREGLRTIASPADLAVPAGGAPGVIVSAEGADFLEGRIDRVDEAYQRWTLRHLQLTHYRVNELGDIQTEPPVHGGLTDFGAEVIRRCERLGIVVDVAHGTLDLVKRAASVATKPLILSHTSLTSRPGPWSRQITAEHANLIAATGGVIGVWPVSSIYPTMAALAAGMAHLASIVGADHVGLGTDLRGLAGASTIADYHELPLLAEALLAAGFSQAEAAKVLGGNYARVFAAAAGKG